jgi:predicted anti-sigma-YlaC factor YlaD
VKCDVAREALSARIDGEREPVPSARVDEHLDECADCRAWLELAADHARELRLLAQARPVISALSPLGALRAAPPSSRSISWQRWALLAVGVLQVALGVVQGLGMDVGLAHNHGMGASGHLLNESTAWSTALGLVMVGAAVWPTAAAGLAGVLSVFVAVLSVYVAVDALDGAVSPERMASHLPVVIGAVLAIMVWRSCPVPSPEPKGESAEEEIRLPPNASRGRRRGHLWPTDGAA